MAIDKHSERERCQLIKNVPWKWMLLSFWYWIVAHIAETDISKWMPSMLSIARIALRDGLLPERVRPYLNQGNDAARQGEGADFGQKTPGHECSIPWSNPAIWQIVKDKKDIQRIPLFLTLDNG